jgi:hypothetical protein
MFKSHKNPHDEDNSAKSEEQKNSERRQHKRLDKNLILIYYEKNSPTQKYEITQLKNISKGGMCFISSRAIEPLTQLTVELKTPYFSHTTYIDGFVLESHVKAHNLIYQTRLQFQNVDLEKSYVIEKLIEFIEKESSGHEHS